MNGPVFLKAAIRVPQLNASGGVRCRVEYGPEILSVAFTPWQKQPIRSLKQISVESIDYHAKFIDRTALNALFSLRGNCDEIIIVKQDRITDTSISNLIFFDGTAWITPTEPLLPGTCRERLLALRKISARTLRPADLGSFSGVKLINALRDPDEEEMIPISNIVS